jgi:hypothetical protein
MNDTETLAPSEKKSRKRKNEEEEFVPAEEQAPHKKKVNFAGLKQVSNPDNKVITETVTKLREAKSQRKQKEKEMKVHRETKVKKQTESI